MDKENFKKRVQYEKEISQRVFDYTDPYGREIDDTAEKTRWYIQTDAFHVIEFLLDLLDDYSA